MASSAAPREGKGSGGASPEEFAAWTEELLALEIQAEDEETTSLLKNCSHSELQARGIALLKLHVAEHGTALYGRACLVLERPGSGPLPAHRISNGDIVGLFDQTLRPLSKAVPLVSAVVQSVKPASISLAFDAEIPTEVLDGRQLNLATVSSDVTMRRYREALDVLKSGRVEGPAAGLVSVCFGEEGGPRFREPQREGCGRPDAVDCTFRAEQTHSLNEPQQAAVVKALCAVDIAIVHGPPGTGKTTTLVAYILEAVYRKQRLLVCAPSNVAVDNLLERVVACGVTSAVRLGHPARVQSDLHKYTMDNIVYKSDQAGLCRDIKKDIDDALKTARDRNARKEAKIAKAELTNLRKELRQRERRAVAEVLRHTQVVFATCAGAATLHREIRKGASDAVGGSLEFDVVIIDEAAQALEVACWIPLLLGKKAVLAGDHQQLAATVKSTEAQRGGLDRTLFGRMIKRHGDDVAALLSIQYRMNEIIMGWSSRSFYDSRLLAAVSVASRCLELSEDPAANLVGDVLEMLQSPLLFVDTCGLGLYREDEDSSVQDGSGAKKATHAAIHQSRANSGESRFVVHYAKMLVRCGISPKSITVIAPYSRQVERLRLDFADDAECPKLGLETTRVNTVDSFQGQEADCVLISLVRSNERGAVGFLADYRRLNVAVTRGRKHVMLIGDAATISTDDMLGSLYDYACECGKVAFVEQLLAEDGTVPPDPASVTAPDRSAKTGKKMEQRKDKPQENLKDEEEVRSRMMRELSLVAEAGGLKEFPPNLNPFERAIAHEVAASLGLLHESQGEGMQRRLYVWTPGHEPGKAAPAKQNVSGSASAKAAEDNELSDGEQETPLQAFERRAAGTLQSLDAGSPAAEWKAPSAEEREILQRLADEHGLALSFIGGGKKGRLRIESSELVAAFSASAAAASGGRAAASSGGAANAVASSHASADSDAASGGAANGVLAGLHAERRRRQEEEAQARKEVNESAKAELKQAKKQGKQKQQAMTRTADDDDDDLDAVLLEFTAKEGICAFGACKDTLIDPISKCKHCLKRFCLKHVQAELHGCGDVAQRTEQKRFKESFESNGSGLVNKPAADREALAAKLQGRVGGQAASRTKKSKDKT
eukprot:CAMPEP_0203935742 /NCGR_PEP_ID=MMETSP0359-20131031/73440_1 /ASSEMBLY_ACC=CAM_ASM_000338 /TAXON_ID=268821 /ORGANISM="Scrippsiella Hangoei, Strain SHTV-5" /LENGTH=1115 /DNA_ID=CAMNT_0050865629 /DNA_START=66 /DNA_END=3413 /DNA_ORIENTATION=-